MRRKGAFSGPGQNQGEDKSRNRYILGLIEVVGQEQCYQTKMGGWLSAATKGKLERQRLVRKERGFYLDAE